MILLNDLDKWIINFIWSGDVDKRKLVIVPWNKSCRPIIQGGLGIRSLMSLNEAANLKLCWDLRNSSQPWAKLLKSRCIRKKNLYLITSIQLYGVTYKMILILSMTK